MAIEKVLGLGATGIEEKEITVGSNEQAFRIEAVAATTTGQTTFTVPGGYTPGTIIVTLNGSTLLPSDYVATDGTTIILTSGADIVSGTILVIIIFSTFNVADIPASTWGKAFISSINAAAGRSALGLGSAATATVQTSATDTTAGALLAVGAFGLGNVPIFFTDANALPAVTGFFGYLGSGTNIPSGGLGGDLLFQQYFNVNAITQKYTFYQNGRVFVRSWNVSAWSTWREVYTQSSILGTVSQSAGIPTGAIIEYGSNANGEYWRYAGGMQICTNSNNAIATNPATFTGTVTDIDGSKLRVGRWF